MADLTELDGLPILLVEERITVSPAITFKRRWMQATSTACTELRRVTNDLPEWVHDGPDPDNPRWWLIQITAQPQGDNQ